MPCSCASPILCASGMIFCDIRSSSLSSVTSHYTQDSCEKASVTSGPELQLAGYQVPSMLLRLLNKQPAVKEWFRDNLKVTDLRDGAPSVRQLHDNPVTASTSVAKYLEGDFNNPAAYPDAVVLVKGQEIHVHRQVVAEACKVLARRWDPLWSTSHTSFAMDESLCCEACSIYPSHGTALLFLEYFYTGDVNWPGGQAEVGCALELLVMACMCDVQHLVCIAEKALQDKLIPEICCSILAVADHHQAVQLRECCMHLIKKLYKTIRQSEEFKLLSSELRDAAQAPVGCTLVDFGAHS